MRQTNGLATKRPSSAPFSVSDYFWQQAERVELSPKNAYDQWRIVIGRACTTWTAYVGGSQSRLNIHDGTVSCLRSSWPVAASEFSPQGKPTFCNPPGCSCIIAAQECLERHRPSLFFRRKSGKNLWIGENKMGNSISCSRNELLFLKCYFDVRG